AAVVLISAAVVRLRLSRADRLALPPLSRHRAPRASMIFTPAISSTECSRTWRCSLPYAGRQHAAQGRFLDVAVGLARPVCPGIDLLPHRLVLLPQHLLAIEGRHTD